jgi:POT family proton-dependent oligopeptide transporter
MGITFFIKYNVNKHVFGGDLPTQWILNLNSIVVILGAPTMLWIINRLQLRGFKVSVCTQFTCAFLMLSLSFLFLSCAVIFSNNQGYCSLIWVVLYVIAQSIAELLIGPVGYAMIGRISPTKLQGILMGTWLMVSGTSASLSHFFSNAMIKTDAINPLLTNADYLCVFNQLCLWPLVGAIFLYLLRRIIMNVLSDNTKSEENFALAN